MADHTSHGNNNTAPDTAAPDITIHDIHPDVIQSHASDPSISVWVAASAGTGKTKVLTDRVLRLLLPRSDGRPGTEPHRILGLTYTKAAAGEMLLRINKTLSQWAVANGDDLQAHLKKLTGHTPDDTMISAARSLFAKTVDTPGGLKIMTIHSFCQSVLARFPLEAGIAPHFQVIEEARAKDLLLLARQKILGADTAPALQAAMTRIAPYMNEQQFEETLQDLLAERGQLLRYGMDLQETKEKLHSLHGIPDSLTEEELLSAVTHDDNFDKNALYTACTALAESDNNNDRQRSINIQDWLDAPMEKRAYRLESYISIFLTAKYQPRKTLITKAAAKNHPTAPDILHNEALRLIDYHDSLTIIRSINALIDILMICHEIIRYYQTYKEQAGLLDFDDIITRTAQLLNNKSLAPWVMFKLDGGLDHLLIDEAQDTSPEQWDIITNLCDEFFSGDSTRDSQTERTIFAVGDKKQSIYSFQRADPAGFETMQQHFEQKAQAHSLKMAISFRSTKTILDLVDRIFAPEDIRRGLEHDIITHESFRRGQGGIAELWPLEKPDGTPDDQPWQPPVMITRQQSGDVKLAAKIAAQIRSWLDNGEELESHARPITAGDIMILVQTRTAFQNHLVRALKSRNIPVSGIDRMILGDQIAVMDLLALARFSLLQEDDLSLACILKSPLIGWDDDALFPYAHGRPHGISLWQSLQDNNADPAILSYLQDKIDKASHQQPFDFFSNILHTPCPASPYSGLYAIHRRLGDDAFDPIDECLNACQYYEKHHTPSLQGFIIWQQKDDIIIKRELEEAGHAVRIMTVHGAKGLQAPIVFLPDTTRTPDAKQKPSFLWPLKTTLPVPLWSPRKDMNTQLFDHVQDILEQKRLEEYHRLLYVAMTRAEERLYICGYTKKRDPGQGNWYDLIKAAFTTHPNHKTISYGTYDHLQIKDFRTNNPDRKTDHVITQSRPHTVRLPEWAHMAAEIEPFPVRPMAPSRPQGARPAARSPLDSIQEHSFQRGNMTHKLLQILPDLPAHNRREAAQRFLSLPAHDLSPVLQDSILEETMAILESPDYALFFGTDSMAEIPVTGYVGDSLISGQIDRIYITPTDIHILDYKTNRPPPTDPRDIPESYRKQLLCYRDIVAKIYTNHNIHCYILWTDGARLIKLDLSYP